MDSLLTMCTCIWTKTTLINPRAHAEHAQKGYGSRFVCLYVCMYVCLSVCLSHPNLKNNSSTRQNQGTNV